jgi:hypothetical protein
VKGRRRDAGPRARSGGERLEPRNRVLLGLGLVATLLLTAPGFLYLAGVLGRALGLDPDAPLWRQKGSEPGRQAGSLWTPWGWEHVRGAPQFALAAVFVLLILAAIPFSSAGQAIISRWEGVDGRLSIPAIAAVVIALVVAGVAAWWLAVVVVAAVSVARGRLTRDEALALVVRGRCPEAWKATRGATES